MRLSIPGLVSPWKLCTIHHIKYWYLLTIRNKSRQWWPWCNRFHWLFTVFKGTVAWYGFLAYSFPSCLDKMYLEVFWIWPLLTKVGQDFAHRQWWKRKVWGWGLMAGAGMRWYHAPTLLGGVEVKLVFWALRWKEKGDHSHNLWFHSNSDNKRCRRMRGMKLNPVGECAEWNYAL